ncbi:MAG: metalloregulator ArsR/SmtB family transcription factor [Alphaproteobacteria bacterium]|nr:metalloregulator ArsR/SmtB family transcription factor [Alphaproteobacteria bacterium]
MAYDNAFAAMADPTRRTVLERLKAGPRTVGDIAAGLPVSRPAVSQHLKALKAADLVRDEPRGAARLYRLHAPGLQALRAYLDDFWDEALARFKDHAESEDERD